MYVLKEVNTEKYLSTDGELTCDIELAMKFINFQLAREERIFQDRKMNFSICSIE